jgi:hypothetical protein
VATSSTRRPVTLPAGTRLVDAMAAELEALGASSGQVELLDGSLCRISYCIPALSPDGSTVATFSATYEAGTPARLIGGSATVGFRGGKRFAHCHAAWFDADGNVRGGHLWPETTVGPGPVHAIVHAFDEVELISETDPESRLPVFTPHRRPVRAVDRHGAARGVSSRLAPGVVVDTAIQEIMREHGFDRASIAGSVGSLVGAILHRGGDVFVVDGPATEVTLTGEFDLRDPDNPVSRVSGMAVDRFGTVHAGEFVNAENIVAITVELLVEEVAL